ncbi:hypothetical protein [Methanobrevibacter arboriphilus]
MVDYYKNNKVMPNYVSFDKKNFYYFK